jgi:hypothetical protein
MGNQTSQQGAPPPSALVELKSYRAPTEIEQTTLQQETTDFEINEVRAHQFFFFSFFWFLFTLVFSFGLFFFCSPQTN